MMTPVENGIDLKEVSRSGSVLQIQYEDFENTYHQSDGVSVEDTLGEPPQHSFEETSKDMVIVDKYGFVKKKILEQGGGEILDENCTVGMAYSGYFEGNSTPFILRPPVKPLDCNMREDGTLLCGLRTAVLSMKVGELSMFVLSYKVMFGEMGNPPQIKPKADCLFFIKVIRSKLISDIKELTQEPNNFTNILKECIKLYKSGTIFFQDSNTHMARRCFNKAANIMQCTRLANEEEEKKQEEFLLKLYYNLAVCYNRLKNPRRACCMCNEINRLKSIWTNGKALYQNARALRMLGDFKASEKRLKQALKLCPDMKNEIEEEMKKLLNKMIVYEQSKLMAMKIVQEENKTSEVSENFKIELEILVKQFVHDPEICNMTLPQALNSAELKYVEEVAKKYNLKCAKFKSDLSLDKSSPSDSTVNLFDD